MKKNILKYCLILLLIFIFCANAIGQQEYEICNQWNEFYPFTSTDYYISGITYCYDGYLDCVSLDCPGNYSGIYYIKDFPFPLRDGVFLLILLALGYGFVIYCRKRNLRIENSISFN